MVSAMTSPKKAAANRTNALKSTGPRTAEGKQRASMNALTHGLRAATLAVPHLESREDWEAHRSLVVRDLAPVGYMETVLSERIAATLWRLGRVVRYESEVVSIAVVQEPYGMGDGAGKTVEALLEDAEMAEEREKAFAAVRALKGKARVPGEEATSVLDEVAGYYGVTLYEGQEDVVELNLPGVPDSEPWEDWKGWTRDLVDLGVQRIAAAGRERAPDMDERVRTTDPWDVVGLYLYLQAAEARKAHEGRVAALDRHRREALLPREETLEKVTRYETHLERSLFRTLHELQRLQAVRNGGMVPIPAALDVDVSILKETT